MDVRHVPLADLDLSLARLRQLPDARVRAKAESLRRKGQLSPLVAADCDGALVLVDGFLRHQAAMRLGLEALLVDVVRLEAVHMKAQLYLRNRERGLELLEECRLVHELVDVDGLSQVEIAELLDRHKTWVCRRLGLYRGLSPHLLAADALNGLPGGSLRRVARLPARNQERVLAVAQRDGIPPHDVGALADLVRRAPNPLATSYVLDHPADALARARARAEKAVDPELGEAGTELLAGLTALRQVALRVARRVAGGLGTLPPGALNQLRTATGDAARDCTAALDAAKKHLAPDDGRTP
ncbi:MAG: ParB/RepB/Spo0J family partition protein [Candidatus Sericytochromatia bacterium]